MSYPRLDEIADRIVKKTAQEIAYEYGLDYVGTEHILLAILRDGQGVAARVLKSFGIDEAKARKEIDAILQLDKEDTWVFGRLPGSPHYRNVVARAIDEAVQLESDKIGTEHLLLALLREETSAAQRALVKMGATAKKCREAILKALPA